MTTSPAELHPCVAHRGWSGGAPENTLAAFKLAMTEPAVYWIELDVHLSRDEVPVVIHDGTLNRTTNAKGRVRDLTAAELAKLDAGSWFHQVYAGEPVPTLEQVLYLTAGRCRLNIEMKEGTPDADRFAHRVASLLRAYRREHDTVITSFEPLYLKAVKRHAPEIRTGLITDKRPTSLIATLKSLEASVLSIAFGHVGPSLLKETEAARIQVMAWTPNHPRDLARLAAMPQPFQICTNYPDRWLAAVQKGSFTP
ncbi:glycerophosphodiester phosphodiesterase [Cohnella nanjingensis]|uniref:Glycerophosphodiester phosphodiesterase n=1 Tax=Cohnella nanjingensis TaxID=1387779 RepID=A0A7X0RUK5_9BACL|nr:glycerophosphodiester phosphodiesterase family protein [Cohnella nanjingensis]MBB6673880.1 glycerophosphodiester phosphodiesterase [Cohnella nanjingensis]